MKPVMEGKRTRTVKAAWFAVAVFLGAAVACVRTRVQGEPAWPGSCLRTYWSAQRFYRKTDWDGDGVFEYAFPYVMLNTQRLPDSGPIRLIDDAFANASRDNPLSGTTVPNHGYLFVDLVGDANKGAYYDGKGDFVNGHGLCAYPETYRRTGLYTLIIDARGKVYAKDTGGKPVVVFPDAENEGWECLGG